MSARIKRLGLMGVLALSALSVYACGDDDDGDNTPWATAMAMGAAPGWTPAPG